MSGFFGRPFEEAAKEEGLTLSIDIGSLYADYQLARMFGWTLEYIRSLGLLESEAFLQFADADQALVKARTRQK